MKKKILSFFLCLLILLSFPATAYAFSYSNTIHFYYKDGSKTYSDHSTSTSFTISDFDTYQSSLDNIYFNVLVNKDIKKGDNVTISFVNDYYCYYDGDITSRLRYYDNETMYNVPYDFDYNSDTHLVSITFTAERDYYCSSTTDLSATFIINNNSSEPYHTAFIVKNLQINTTSESSTYQSGVIGKLQQLLDKVTSSFTDLKSSFSAKIKELSTSITTSFDNWGQSIVNWFSSIGTHLTDIKSSIKTWFNGLGDRISGFFDNIWTNINDKVDGIEQKFKDFKQDVSDWFDNLFKPEEGYFDNYKATWETWFSEHFGFLYDSYFLVIDTFVLMQNSFDVEGSGVIYIPSIDLPLPNASYTIVEEHLLDFNELIQSHEIFSTLIEGFRMGATVIIYLGLVLYGKKSLEKILAEREL